MLDPGSIQKILLIRLSAIGDVINTLPAVTAVRAAYPRARLGFLVEDKAREVVEGHPDLDEILVYPRRRWRRGLWNPLRLLRTSAEVIAYVRDLRSREYDVVLDFQGNLKGGLHAALSGVPVRIGYSRDHSMELNHWFSTIRVRPWSQRINRVEKFLALLAPLGISASAARYRLPASPESGRFVDEFLRSAGLEEHGFVVMHPGTSVTGREKRWPLDRFAALATRVKADLGLRTVVAWGPGERDMAEEVVRGSSALLAAETRSLLDLAELLRRSRVFVGADSGPLHLASAVGAPSVALFGPKDPGVYGPWNPRHRLVYRPNGNGRGSMDAITVDDALAALRELA